MRIAWAKTPKKLIDCPVGLFVHCGKLYFKMKQAVHSCHEIRAYSCDDGEEFWDGISHDRPDMRADIMVRQAIVLEDK